jgi:3-hydroxyisobutyrate dehydrogenase-like beta-hydroxyacid dehydrogenase
MHETNKQLPSSVGLIGIGLVGTVLAEHFLALGVEVVGYDIDTNQCDRFQGMGGCCVDSPRAVAQRVNHLVLSLPDTTVVREVIEGRDGLLAAQDIPAYVIDTTTGDPEDTVDLAEQLARHNSAYLDATICGASSQLRTREAVFMVGGQETAYEACKPMLEVLARHIFYMGPSGAGSKAKLATNLVLGLNRLVLAEGMVFAEALGLAPETFLELLKVSPAYSVAVDVKGEKMLKGDFTPVSRIRQHHKDVALMLKHARNQNQSLPLAQLHLDILAEVMATGEGDLDTSAVIKEIRRRNFKN